MLLTSFRQKIWFYAGIRLEMFPFLLQFVPFLAKSCGKIKYHSPQATSGSYAIDPDEEPWTLHGILWRLTRMELAWQSSVTIVKRQCTWQGMSQEEVMFATSITYCNRPNLCFTIGFPHGCVLSLRAVYQVRVPRFNTFEWQPWVVGVKNWSTNDILGRSHTSWSQQMRMRSYFAQLLCRLNLWVYLA